MTQIVQIRPNIIPNMGKIATKHKFNRDCTLVRKATLQLTTLQTTVTTLQATKSILGHTHISSPTGGPTTPSFMKRGGKVNGRTKPITTNKNENLRRKLINDIKKLQNQNNG